MNSSGSRHIRSHNSCFCIVPFRARAFILFLCLIVSTLIGPLAARAELCTIDAVPAATLLLPYFEVDLNEPSSKNTVFNVTNSSPAPILINVTLWTNASIPTLNFSVFLTGYDVQAIDLSDVFLNGNLPPSNDFNCDTIQGDNLSGTQSLGLRNAHTGKASSLVGNQCAGIDIGDNLARGYITIDNINACTTGFPTSAAYFVAAGAGVASNSNDLMGDYYILDEQSGLGFADKLTAIEADNAAFNAGDETFYGRFLDVPFNGSDGREPLASAHIARYEQGQALNQSTIFNVWREPGSELASFACNTPPSVFPLPHEQIVVFDEQENAVEILSADLKPFPYEASSAQIGSSTLPSPYDEGWLYFNLNSDLAGPPTNNPIRQSVVTVSRFALDRFNSGQSAVQVFSACSGLNGKIVIP